MFCVQERVIPISDDSVAVHYTNDISNASWYIFNQNSNRLGLDHLLCLEKEFHVSLIWSKFGKLVSYEVEFHTWHSMKWILMAPLVTLAKIIVKIEDNFILVEIHGNCNIITFYSLWSVNLSSKM